MPLCLTNFLSIIRPPSGSLSLKLTGWGVPEPRQSRKHRGFGGALAKGGVFVTKPSIIFVRAAAFALGVVFMAMGIVRGEPTEVMRKAVVVCLECIGIG